MKKSMSIMAGMAGAAMLGGAAYVLMDERRKNKAKRVLNKTMDEANDLICRKMN